MLFIAMLKATNFTKKYISFFSIGILLFLTSCLNQVEVPDENDLNNAEETVIVETTSAISDEKNVSTDLILNFDAQCLLDEIKGRVANEYPWALDYLVLDYNTNENKTTKRKSLQFILSDENNNLAYVERVIYDYRVNTISYNVEINDLNHYYKLLVLKDDTYKQKEYIGESLDVKYYVISKISWYERFSKEVFPIETLTESNYWDWKIYPLDASRWYAAIVEYGAVGEIEYFQCELKKNENSEFEILNMDTKPFSFVDELNLSN